jgi:hypothetical protein
MMIPDALAASGSGAGDIMHTGVPGDQTTIDYDKSVIAAFWLE